MVKDHLDFHAVCLKPTYLPTRDRVLCFVINLGHILRGWHTISQCAFFKLVFHLQFQKLLLPYQVSSLPLAWYVKRQWIPCSHAHWPSLLFYRRVLLNQLALLTSQAVRTQLMMASSGCMLTWWHMPSPLRLLYPKCMPRFTWLAYNAVLLMSVVST